MNNYRNHTESVGFTEEDLIAVVNESAEKGLVFFGNLLGLAFGKSDSTEEDISLSNTTSTP